MGRGRGLCSDLCTENGSPTAGNPIREPRQGVEEWENRAVAMTEIYFCYICCFYPDRGIWNDGQFGPDRDLLKVGMSNQSKDTHLQSQKL
jgi:hypothetical protein